MIWWWLDDNFSVGSIIALHSNINQHLKFRQVFAIWLVLIFRNCNLWLQCRIVGTSLLPLYLWSNKHLFCIQKGNPIVACEGVRLKGLMINWTASGAYYCLDLLTYFQCLLQHWFVQSYSRDLFIFLYLLLLLVSAVTSLRKHVDKSVATGKSILYLNRHQTEEWKGWMQVCIWFACYHVLFQDYFSAPVSKQKSVGVLVSLLCMAIIAY